MFILFLFYLQRLFKINKHQNDGEKTTQVFRYLNTNFFTSHSPLIENLKYLPISCMSFRLPTKKPLKLFVVLDFLEER